MIRKIKGIPIKKKVKLGKGYRFPSKTMGILTFTTLMSIVD